jgi:hypothetical protein
MKPISLKYKHELRNLNIVAGILHSIFALLILITVIVIDSPFYLIFQKIMKVPDVDNFPDVLTSNTCNNTIYTNVFVWLDECIDDEFFLPPMIIQITFLSQIKVWILVFVFEIITALSHLLLVFNEKRYYEDLQMKINPARWREYSITNTIMIIAILSLSNASDVYLLISIGLAALSMNYVGGLIYDLLSSLQTVKTIDKRRLYLIKEAKFMILLISYTTFILSIVYIFDIFLSAVNPLYDLPNASLWSELFLIVFILNIGIIFAYASFPILHFIQYDYFNLQFNVDYVVIEKGYIFASLIAKSFLSLIVFVASVQRNI